MCAREMCSADIFFRSWGCYRCTAVVASGPAPTRHARVQEPSIRACPLETSPAKWEGHRSGRGIRIPAKAYSGNRTRPTLPPACTACSET